MKWGLGILALIVGCDAGSHAPVLDYESTVATRTAGVAYFERGDIALVGMFGTTCDVYTSVGQAATDYAFPGDADRVLDALDGRILVTTEQGAWTGTLAGNLEVADHSVLDGVLLQDGLAVLDGGSGCAVHWIGQATDTVHLPARVCADLSDFTGSRYNGSVWVADGELTEVSSDGVVGTLGAADRVVWDDHLDMLYVGTLDGLVRGLDADGVEKWATQLDGTLQALSTLGTQGMAVAVVEQWDGRVVSIFMEGWSGVVLAEQDLPSATHEVVASPDGTRIAFERETSTAFFRIAPF